MASAPVTTNPNVPARLVRPIAWHPHRSRTRRHGPVARSPRVAPAVPAVISRHPNVPRTRSHDHHFARGRWRSEPYIHARGLRFARRQSSSENHGKKNLFHGSCPHNATYATSIPNRNVQKTSYLDAQPSNFCVAEIHHAAHFPPPLTIFGFKRGLPATMKRLRPGFHSHLKPEWRRICQ